MKIVLFRHGDKKPVDSIFTDDKKSVQLSKLGINQIEKLAHTLIQRFPELKSSSVIYSSFYTRSIQSATIVQSILNIKKIISFSEFGEFTAYNNYLNPKEIREHLQAYALQNPDWIPPETNISLNQAVSGFESRIRQIVSQNKTNLILISTHGGIIRNLVYSLEEKFRPNNKLIAQSKIHEAGYTVLNFDGQNFSVDQFNIHDFL